MECTVDPACTHLLFSSKFPDVQALNQGEAAHLRPLRRAGAQRQRPQADRRVAMVIGGNGFIGAHLIGRLSTDPGIDRVYALVRPTADATALARLQDTIARYRIDANWTKIHVLGAAATERRLGLSLADHDRLANEVGSVFSCASSTDYDVGYLKLRDDWFLGLLKTIEFCLEGATKHLTYLGSVGGRLYQDAEDFRRPDSWWYSGYCQLTWVNAALIEWLHRDRVLPVTLCEAPYILGSTQLGLDPGTHYSWWRGLEIAKNIGAIWDSEGINYCPVDILVETLVGNALRSEPLALLRPSNTRPYHTSLLAELLDCRVLPWAEFSALAIERVGRRRAGKLLSTDPTQAVKLVNLPAVFPPGIGDGWCDNRRLFSLFISRQNFLEYPRPSRAAAREPALEICS